MLVEGVEDAAGPEEDVAEDRLEGADTEDVAELPAGAEPGGGRQHLDDRRPHQRTEAEEAGVLERVQRAVVERGLVEDGDVPDADVDCPERQRDERMREPAQRVDRADREDRPQDRSGQPGDDRERGEVTEKHVLGHVKAQELLLAERVDR